MKAAVLRKKPTPVIGQLSRALVLLLLAALCTIGIPQFRTSYNIINVIRQTSLLAIMSFGMTIAMLSGGLDLSIGSVIAFSSCVAGSFLVHGQNLSGITIGLLVGAASGLATGLAIGLLRLPPFIATWGMMQIARGLALSYTGGYSYYGFHPAFRWLGTGFFLGIPAPVFIGIIVFVFLHWLTRRTVFGRSLYATGSNPEAARASGIPVGMIQVKTYVLSGLLSGLAGLVYAARVNAAEPVIGQLFALDAIAASVIGGTSFRGGEGGVAGTILGAGIIALLQNALNLLGVSSYWQVFVRGVVIVIAVTVDLYARRRQ